MQGKKKYVALILFLVIGLIVFTFANPADNDEKKTSDKTNSEEVVENEVVKDEETNDTFELQQNDDALVNKEEVNLQQVIEQTDLSVVDNDGYEKALQAVKKAEESLILKDYNDAQALVNNLVDSSNKEELVKRLENVLAGINASELVAKLEKMVNEATKLADMNDARDFNDDNKVKETIETLANESLKESLTKRLDKLNVLLDDTNKPVISGLNDGDVVNTIENLKIEDENSYTIYLNDEEYELGTKLTDDGNYTLVVTDSAFNETVVNFTYDTTAPEVNLKYSTEELTNKSVTVTLTTNEAVTLSNESSWFKVSDTEFRKVFPKNTTQEIVVTDKVGNTTNVKIEINNIDKTAPEATITYSNNNGNALTNKDVTVTLTSNESILTPEGWTRVKDKVYTKVYSENKKDSVVITDKAGNVTTIDFEVKRIDKVAPSLTIKDPNKYYIEAGTQYVDKGYSAYDAVDKDVTNLVKISYLFQANGSNEWKEVNELDTTKLGVYKLTYTAYDKAGNTNKGTRVVAIEDTVAPKFIGLQNGHKYDSAMIRVEDVTLDTISVYSYSSRETFTVLNNSELQESGTYKITAIDKAGNASSIYFTVE